MAEHDPLEPSDRDLLAFAQTILGGKGSGLTDPEILQETIAEARDLWVLLYRAHLDPPPPTR